MRDKKQNESGSIAQLVCLLVSRAGIEPGIYPDFPPPKLFCHLRSIVIEAFFIRRFYRPTSVPTLFFIQRRAAYVLYFPFY